MCSRVVCRSCGKYTYSGCGRHIESALGSIPLEQRCAGWKTGRCPAQN